MSSRPLHQPSVQREDRIFFQPWSRPHQRQEQYEPHRYHLQGNIAVTYHIMRLFMLLFCSISTHTDTKARIPCIPNLFPCNAPEPRRNPLPEPYHTEQQPGNKPVRPLQILTFTYSSSGFTQRATLDGRVHEVYQPIADILTLNPETNNGRTLLYILISLSNFMGRQRGTASRTVEEQS